MTTCLDIVTDALKLGKVIASGDTPTSDESADGLNCLQSLYDSWVMGGMFGRLRDKYMTEDENVEEGIRYYVPTGLTLTENATIAAEDSAEGVRQPRDLSMYEKLTQAGVRTVKVYDRTEWVSMTGLTLVDDAPLADRGRMGLAATLACSGAFMAMFGDAALSPNVQRLCAQFQGQISGKMGSTQDTEAGVYY